MGLFGRNRRRRAVVDASPHSSTSQSMEQHEKEAAQVGKPPLRCVSHIVTVPSSSKRAKKTPPRWMTAADRNARPPMQVQVPKEAVPLVEEEEANIHQEKEEKEVEQGPATLACLSCT